MRKTRSWLVAAIASAACVVGFAAPAQASVGQCSSGQECIWTGTSYSGSFHGSTGNMDFTWPSTWNDVADSAASYGNTYCARFWEDVGYTGHYIYFSRPALGGTYRDPALSNGGGYGPYNSENWANRISSGNWQSC